MSEEKPENSSNEHEQLNAELQEANKQKSFFEKKCKHLEMHIKILEKQRQKWLAQDLGSQKVAELSQEVNSLNIETILNVAVNKIALLLNAKYSSLFSYDYKNHELVLLKHNHDIRLPKRVHLDDHPDSLMAKVIESGEMLLLPSIEDYERDHGIIFERPNSHKYQTSSCIVCPLKAGGRTMGILNFADKVDGSVFDEKIDRTTIVQLSEIVGSSMSNHNLYIETQKQARTDGLTELTNHRTFMEILNKEAARAKRYKDPLSLLMMDLDHFKKFNDTYGHQTGDYVLQETAKIIRESVREKIDIPARYGGEEFAVILPSTNIIGAKTLAERIRIRINNHRFHFNNQDFSVTMSIGLTQFSDDQSPKKFIENADMALYEAKNNGRNRVEQFIGS